MNIKDFEGKFIGSDLIKKAEVIEDKTYLEKDKIRLTFDDENIAEYPLEVVEQIISPIVKDFTDLRLRRLTPVAEKILILLTESELKKEDMEYLLTKNLMK
jgi:hypothetical protein